MERSTDKNKGNPRDTNGDKGSVDEASGTANPKPAEPVSEPTGSDTPNTNRNPEEPAEHRKLREPTLEQLKAARARLEADRARAAEENTALEATQKTIKSTAKPAGKPVEREVRVKQSDEPKHSSFSSMLEAASEKLAEPRTKKAKEKAAEENDPQQELSTLISSVIVIVITAANFPQNVKPDDDEIHGFSYHITNILFRHVPIKHGLPADFLDIIGIMAITASWYSRVAPFLTGGGDHPGNSGKRPTPPRRPTPPPDDISMVDPATAAFLISGASGGGNGQGRTR